MADPLAEAYRALQQEYLAELPSRLAAIDDAAARALREELGARHELAVLLHRLAGASGSYGLPEVSELARPLSVLLEQDDALATTERVASELPDLARRIEAARARLLTPPD